MKSNYSRCPNRIASNRKRRQGAIVPLIAVVLLALVVVGGIAIDGARLQLGKAELRTAADCVARSASNELAKTDSQALARTRAKEIAAKFQVGGQPFQITDSDIVFGRSTTDNAGVTSFTAGGVPTNAVRVLARRETGSAAGAMSMMIGSMFGVDQAELESDATAGFRSVDVCFVLDRSSSMKLGVSENVLGMSFADPRFLQPPVVSSRWEALDRAVDDFLNELKKTKGDEKVGIVTYGSDLYYLFYHWLASTIDFPLSSDLVGASATMKGLSNSVWNGNTYIEAGMRDGITALNGVGSRTNAEKIMIVLTDGIQNVGECRNAATDAAAMGITVHTITFSDFADQVCMKDVADIGQGRHAHADDEATLKLIMKNLATNMTQLID